MNRTLFNRYSSITVFISLALLASLSCVAGKDTRSAGAAEGISTLGSLAAATSPQGVAPAASSTPTDSLAGSKTASSTASRVSNDSAAKDPPITVPSVKGRTKKDSLALVKAVKAGLDSSWPVKTAPPLPGSILPTRRIIAYYGNPLSKRMGILGELPPDQMLARLDKEVEAWRKADPATPVQPALHLIAVVAQAGPGRDGKYRLRMADTLIERVASWAAQRNALLFLDVQVGHSTMQEELPRLIPFLRRPNVHLGLDPEFSMKPGKRADGTTRERYKPGEMIGVIDASDVNYAIGMLSDLVTKNNLPPKVLVVHRFTRNMVTNAKKIKLDPRVQVVIHMDGWGQPWLKYDSYRSYVEAEPVQFTGFKIFYKNDTRKGDPIVTPSEVMLLNPKPVYIQYQ